MYIPPAQYWRKLLSRGKYPLLFIYELNQGLLATYLVTGTKAKLTTYCRIQGGSYLAEKEALEFVQELRQVLQKNPQKTLAWIKEYFRQTKEFLNWLAKVNVEVRKRQLNQLDLKKIYQRYERKVAIIWRWGYLPFLMDDALMLEFNDLLIKLGVRSEKIAEILKVLTVLPKATLHRQEEIELLKLAVKVKKSGSAECQRQIRNHLNKWAWKHCWIYAQRHLTKKELAAEILSLVKKNPAQILAKLEKEQTENLAVRKKLLAQFKNKPLKILAGILAEYAFWHSYKMEEMTKAVYLIKPLLDQLAQKFGLSYQQFIELTPPEVEKEKINLRIINERVKENGVVMIKGKQRIISGQEVRQVRAKIEKPPTDLKILSGLATFPGRLKGRAVIVSETIDIAKVKIKPGEILIAPMTTTNMVPLVKQAAAVVTDEGGLLCHAAIITRELKKPCVTGTKFATKIFKTGDLVAVDANQGIVRKLK